MKIQKINQEARTMLAAAVHLAEQTEADAILLLIDAPWDWSGLLEATAPCKLLVAADAAEHLVGLDDNAAGDGKPHPLAKVVLNMPEAPVYERLTQAVLEAVADDLLSSGASVVALYSGFEAGTIDSISNIHLGDHLGRLTVRDLRQLETRVPLDTLKLVVDLALEIGREGREGKPVGTLFVVGDTRRVLEASHPLVFDPVRGYKRKERSLSDARVRESVKEIAQMDGAFVIHHDGTVEGACRYIDASAQGLTMSKGLGARHWAAAAISRATNALAVTVSESSGTVRLFQNGEVMLRIEPFRRPMKWKDFEFEPPASSGDG
ncbi:MAG: diadenylate cyclase [Pirellulales bacterium]